MKKYIVIILAISVLMVSANFAHALNQDVYNIHAYDANGKLMDSWQEKHYATDEEMTARSIYEVYRITDDDGVTHEFWFSAIYMDLEDDGGWIITGGWIRPEHELLVLCQVLFCRSGRAKRNPTRIDCVYHVGFRFALPDLQKKTKPSN